MIPPIRELYGGDSDDAKIATALIVPVTQGTLRNVRRCYLKEDGCSDSRGRQMRNRGGGKVGELVSVVVKDVGCGSSGGLFVLSFVR